MLDESVRRRLASDAAPLGITVEASRLSPHPVLDGALTLARRQARETVFTAATFGPTLISEEHV